MNAAFSVILFLLFVFSPRRNFYINLSPQSLLSLLSFFLISERPHSAPIFVMFLITLLNITKNQAT